MNSSSAKSALVFASLGHLLMHMLTAFFFVIVLALETEWELPYHELVELWTPGALLVGLGALPAGWLADRWSVPGMMVILFLGMGAACLACARAENASELRIALSALGLFASIYHPVGIPWIVRTSVRSGSALGVNGIFGGLGIACSGGVTGFLVDGFGWRAAFAIPGALSLVLGLVLIVAIRRGGFAPETRTASDAKAPASTGAVRAFCVLMFTMFCLGFVGQADQTALPKVFDSRLADFVGDGTFRVGLIVSLVYTAGAVMQVVGGRLADRYPLERIYIASLLLQVPAVFLIGQLAGVPLIASSVVMVVLGTSVLPAENLLLARHAPERHHGLVFGLKFVVSFGSAPLAIQFVSWSSERDASWALLFSSLAGIAFAAFLASLWLPRTTR